MKTGILVARFSTSANVTIAVQTSTQIQQDRPLGAGVRLVTDGKFLGAGEERFLLKGVTYRTFAPEADGYQFPNLRQVSEDFRLMADLGINTVRTYTPPRLDPLAQPAPPG